MRLPQQVIPIQRTASIAGPAQTVGPSFAWLPILLQLAPEAACLACNILGGDAETTCKNLFCHV